MPDRTLSVLVFASRGVKKGSAQTVSPAGLKDFLVDAAIRVAPSKSDFLKLPEDEQNQLKNGSAFVFGTSRDGSRTAGSLVSRSAVALDVDSLPPEKAAELFQRIKGLPFMALVYGTARDSAACRRLRLVVPLAADITAAKYPAVARGVASLLLDGIAAPDAASFSAAQLMYAPVSFAGVPADVAEHPGTLLDPATIRPSDSGAEAAQDVARQVKQQVDPRTKSGLVGAFCRCYTVPEACEKYLPGQYETVSENRLRPVDSHHSPAVFLYDGGAFVFSFHSNHPAANRLCNAYDWTRLHLFPGDEQASEKNMAGLLAFDLDVQRQLQDDRETEVQADFAAMPTAPQPTALQAAQHDLLSAAARKEPASLPLFAAACTVILNGGTVYKDDMLNEIRVAGMPAPYSPESAPGVLSVLAYDRLRAAGLSVSLGACSEYLSALAERNHVHPAAEYLKRLAWDGVDRLPVLYEILGIENKPQYQTYLRKWLQQAVALALNADGKALPQFVLVLAGEQGIGKSTFFRRLAPRPEFFIGGASLDPDDKDSTIRALSTWICELAELQGTTRSDTARLKSFLTCESDKIRLPYAKAAIRRPRRTCFCSTANGTDLLRDESGSRRFAIIPVEKIDIDRLNAISSDALDQIWAQVVTLNKSGAEWFLTTEEAKQQSAENAQYQREVRFQPEVEVLLDFSLPIEQWSEASAASLATMAGHGCDGLAASAALKNIALSDKRVQRRHTKKGNVWLLPLISRQFVNNSANGEG